MSEQKYRVEWGKDTVHKKYLFAPVHNMMKVQWDMRYAVVECEGSLLRYWDCWGRLFRTVAAFQPGR